MNARLLSDALAIIPNGQMLVNVVRLRVKQLALGHRPLLVTAPGLGMADIALTEIIDGKLTFESASTEDAMQLPDGKVMDFPAALARKKQAA